MSIVQAGMDFPDIMIPATTTSATGTFRNLASVSNPNENAANNYGNNNTDPANVRVQVTNPICSSLNASPAFGVATLNSTLSCSYSNVPANSTLRIECGNGAAVANIATNSNG